jgi:hypothetical protein
MMSLFGIGWAETGIHAPKAECVGKGRTRKRYEFGAKVGIAVTRKQRLIVDAKANPGVEMRHCGKARV